MGRVMVTLPWTIVSGMRGSGATRCINATDIASGGSDAR